MDQGPNGEHWTHGNGTGLTEGGLSAYPAGLLTSANGVTPQTSVNIDVEAPSHAVPSKSSERNIATVRENLVSVNLIIQLFLSLFSPPNPHLGRRAEARRQISVPGPRSPDDQS